MSELGDSLRAFVAAQKAGDGASTGTRDPSLDDADAIDAALAKQEAAQQAAQARMSTPEAIAAARAPAQMPPTARPGDSGLLPMPPTVAQQFGQDVAANLRAVPAGFNDSISAGLIPRISGALGGPGPEQYRQAQAAGPMGAGVGQLGGLAASFAGGPGRLLSAGGAGLAERLAARAPGLAEAARTVAPVAAYNAADTAVRGGSPEDIAKAGGAGVLMAALPGAPGALRQALQGSVDRAEVRGAEKLIDQASWGRVAKAAKQLEPGTETDLENAGKEAIIATARKHGLGPELVSQSPEKFAAAVEAKRADAGKAIGNYIQQADSLTPGVPLDRLLSSLDSVRAQHSQASPEFAALTQEMERLQSVYGNQRIVSGVAHVPLWEVKDLATKRGEQGYAGAGQSFSDPVAAKRLGRQTAWALRQPLYEEANRVALRNPQTVGNPEDFAQAREAFGDLSALSELTKAAHNTGKKGLFARMDALKELGRGVEGVGLGGVSHLLGHSPALSAGMAVLPYVPPAVRAADTGIAKLVNYARSGASPRMYQAAAEELGVHPTIAQSVWQTYAAQAVRGTP